MVVCWVVMAILALYLLICICTLARWPNKLYLVSGQVLLWYGIVGT